MFAIVSVAIATVFPIWIVPLFYRLTPLADPDLRERLLALAARAGVPAIGVYVLDHSRKSRTANAALTGIGRTRRIVLFDTLVADFAPAGLPWLALVISAVGLVAVPLVDLSSRAMERSADDFALELTRDPEAFVAATERLGIVNLAGRRPSRLEEILLFSRGRTVLPNRCWATGLE